MSSFYTSSHKELQKKFDTELLAQGLEDAIVSSTLDTAANEFISGRNLFFLSTVNSSKHPTVSYKGGDVGFVRVLNEHTLVFPSYNGNGMHLSTGNILAHPEIGLLFIDFDKPNRLRIQGRAKLVFSGPLLDSYPGAEMVVEVTISQTWVNCSRYIHQHTPRSLSPHIPKQDETVPIALWKRISGISALLNEKEQAVIIKAGEISAEEYARKLQAGEVV